ncbi:MAG: tRNA-guanine(15) transglycosylase [Methanonatronarchaeales archaeon]|nr:tRNA-guanine(15) transglycosylase [Methanonatronarchaeales archaeon]
MKVLKRHHLRGDGVAEAREALAAFGAELDGVVELAETDSGDVLLLNGEPVAFYSDDRLLPTVRGLMRWAPERRRVTVDMGAVKFIYNGADVMAPGVVDADPSVEEGDAVFVDEEAHHKPLAVGVALVSGEEMVSSEVGRVVGTVHHVGDELWNLLD